MTTQGVTTLRHRANQETLVSIFQAHPVLVDVRPAGAVVPGMSRETILTSGAPMPWESYTDGQRNAIIGGALFEGLASDANEADALIGSGAIRLGPCHDYGCVGSVTGVTTASMPVLVVENRNGGNRAFCTLYEGHIHDKLTYGVYNDRVRGNQLFLRDVIGRVLGEAVRMAGGVALKPIMRRALHMGDDLHTRNAAASMLFTRALFPDLVKLAQRMPSETEQTLKYLSENDYFFLRLSMATSKATSDAAHGVEGSSIATVLTFSCREFAILVGGLGDEWFRAPLPPPDGKVFDGHSLDEAAYMGGESVIAEAMGLGGFAQAAAFTLQDYSRATPQEMIQRNLELYEITVGEHPEFNLPVLQFRGTPVGIDIHRVVETGILPIVHMGLPGKTGGQIGAGIMHVPMTCFEQAVRAYNRRYPSS